VSGPDRRGVRAELDAAVDALGPDELRVLLFLAARMVAGRERYGELRLAIDRRDFERERSEEIADLLTYSAMAELRRFVAGAR
jgi:hypothetical protein